MFRRFWLSAVGGSWLCACTPHAPLADGAQLLDADVTLTRAPESETDTAVREFLVSEDSILVAIVDENSTNVHVRFETDAAHVQPVEVENHLEGAGVEIAAIQLPGGSHAKLILRGPRDRTAPGTPHVMLRRFDPRSRSTERVAGFEAWSAGTHAREDESIERPDLEAMWHAAADLRSAGEAKLSAEAQLIAANMLLQFSDAELLLALSQARLSASAFRSLPNADAMRAARARYIEARALSNMASVPTGDAFPAFPLAIDLPASPQSADAEARRILAELSGDSTPLGPVDRARAMAKIGYVDSDYSLIEDAQKHFEGARVLYHQAGHVAGEVEMRANLAECLAAQGRRYDAAKAYDLVLPDIGRISNADVRVAFLLFAGKAQSFAGRTDDAIANLSLALAQARRYQLGGQERGALQALGLMYWNRGDYYQAKTLLSESLRLSKEQHDDVGRAYTGDSVGMIANFDGDYATAIALHKESVRLAIDPVARLRFRDHLALDYLGSGDYDAAIKELRDALAVKLEDPHHYAYADVKRDLAKTLIEHHAASPAALAEAGKLLAEVTRQAGAVHDELGEIGAHSINAELLAKRHQAGAARAEFERAFALIFDYRRSTSNPQLLTATLGFEQPAFRGYFDLMMQDLTRERGAGARAATRDEEAALRMLERARESHFGATRSVPMDAATSARVDALLASMADKSLEIARLLQSGASAADAAKLAALEVEMAKLRTDVDHERTMAANQAGSAAAVGGSKPAWHDMAPDTVQLSYALGTEHAYVWVRSSKGLSSAMLRDTPEDIERELVALAAASPQTEPDRIEQSLEKISAALLPAGLLPMGTSSIEVVAEGRLANVPFAGLRSPTDASRRLAETHAVTMISSMLRPPPPPRSGGARPFRLVALASGSGTLRAASRMEVAPALQAAKSEIGAVARLFEAGDRSARVKLLTGAEGNARALRGIWSSGVDVVHFATHALADLRQPLASLLVLPAHDASGAPTYLTAGQVQEWRGDADLVFLSACESAIGPPRFAGGMPGLQSAFLRAGARGVVATLWPVEDVLARDFSTDFYRHYTRGASAARALNETQRAWLASTAGDAGERARRRVTALAHAYFAP